MRVLPAVGEYYEVDFKDRYTKEHNGIGLVKSVREPNAFEIEIMEGFEYHKDKNNSNTFEVHRGSPFHQVMKKIDCYKEDISIPELEITFSDIIN